MTHVYALFNNDTDYQEAYKVAEQDGLLIGSDSLKTLREIENEDDIPFHGTSMTLEIVSYALGGIALGIVVGIVLARLPAMADLPHMAIAMFTAVGFGFFGFLAGIFTGASRTDSHRQRLWQAFQPGDLAVLLNVNSLQAGRRLADVFTRHRAHLVNVV